MAEQNAVSPGIKSRLIGLAFAVLLYPLYAAVTHFTDGNRGFVAVCISGAFCAVAYARRDLLKSPRFILALVVLYAAQVILILYVKLPAEFPGYVMAPIAFADVYFLLAIVSFLAKKTTGPA